MSNWIATNELRFVMRVEDVPVTGRPYITSRKTLRILQQKWELNDPKFMYQSEWRDVPIVEEE
jgi:hypothetical protein